jgi:hypothetical protein
MWLTYISGGIGAAIGFSTVNGEPASLGISAILAVAVPGLLSFLRHSVYHRSDAIRGGWDYGQRNNFQIEVGLANLAWGLFALLAVVLDWGMAAIASSFLISGLYFVAVTVFIIVARDVGSRRIGPLIGIGAWGIVMVVLGVLGMAAR